MIDPTGHRLIIADDEHGRRITTAPPIGSIVPAPQDEEYVSDTGYKIGAPEEPEFTYDDDYQYDSTVKSDFGDDICWAWWGFLNWGAGTFGGLEDASKAYSHFRDGNGEDLIIDYGRAVDEDSNIRNAVNNEMLRAATAALDLHQQSGLDSFEMTGQPLSVSGKYYPKTENWQKTLGSHNIWGSASVSFKGDKATIYLTIHAVDRYNFNSGMKDIKSGTPDSVNGRFEVLGWGQEFTTRGEYNLILLLNN